MHASKVLCNAVAELVWILSGQDVPATTDTVYLTHNKLHAGHEAEPRNSPTLDSSAFTAPHNTSNSALKEPDRCAIQQRVCRWILIGILRLC